MTRERCQGVNHVVRVSWDLLTTCWEQVGPKLALHEFIGWRGRKLLGEHRSEAITVPHNTGHSILSEHAKSVMCRIHKP